MTFNSPTMKARRYVDINGVSRKVTAFLFLPYFPSTSFSDTTSILLKHVKPLSAISVIVNLDFSAGSSKHGKARRASVGSICVVAMYLVAPSFVLYEDR